MSEPDASSKIHFRGTLIEMGEPAETSESQERMVTVTLQVPLRDARRMAPLLYSAASYFGTTDTDPDRPLDVRKGSLVVVESSEMGIIGEYRVQRSQTSGLHMVDTESDHEVTLVVKQY